MRTTKTPELPPIDHEPRPYDGPSFDAVMKLRKKHLTPSQSRPWTWGRIRSS